jgi:hypothetical protein
MGGGARLTASRHSLDHDRVRDGLWTRLDVTVGLWKLFGLLVAVLSKERERMSLRITPFVGRYELVTRTARARKGGRHPDAYPEREGTGPVGFG